MGAFDVRSFRSVALETSGRLLHACLLLITNISEQFLFREEFFCIRHEGTKIIKASYPAWPFSDALLWLQGYVEAAQIFERESGTSPGFNLSTITDRTDIRKAVQSGELESAIERVNDLNPEVSQADFHPPAKRKFEAYEPL